MWFWIIAAAVLSLVAVGYVMSVRRGNARRLGGRGKASGSADGQIPLYGTVEATVRSDDGPPSLGGI